MMETIKNDDVWKLSQQLSLALISNTRQVLTQFSATLVVNGKYHHSAVIDGFSSPVKTDRYINNSIFNCCSLFDIS
jgi:hypothetical protein